MVHTSSIVSLHIFTVTRYEPKQQDIPAIRAPRTGGFQRSFNKAAWLETEKLRIHVGKSPSQLTSPRGPKGRTNERQKIRLSQFSASRMNNWNFWRCHLCQVTYEAQEGKPPGFPKYTLDRTKRTFFPRWPASDQSFRLKDLQIRSWCLFFADAQRFILQWVMVLEMPCTSCSSSGIA